ncbi:MAG: HAD family phosphatase [Planctomycetota bacterium]|nr:HAD family phosphatase [Planctomycetota bacterium]MDA1211344.1 HAD family phosphatase [Planctomycetota bacterium]
MIRTILFDMGNVLIYFSHKRMCEQLGLLVGKTEAEVNSWLLDSGLQWDYERGKIDPQRFHELFQDWGNCRIEKEVLHRAGSDIFTANDDILPVLKLLKTAGFRLVLMSNTNEVHFHWVRSEYPVLDRFDDFVLSYEVGAMKPEPAIFEAALSKIKCAPEECFYTDDIAEYIDAARKIGFDAEVFTGVDDLKDHLTRRNILTASGENR